MRVSIVVFPGSNCDHDIEYAAGDICGAKVTNVWHRDRDLADPDLVVLPGGFAFGDYLRTGAMAKVSPAMEEVAKFAKIGGRVLGVCNGFQILCEAGLLPGALLRNVGTKFISRFVHLKVESADCFLTSGLSRGQVFSCPMAHGEGNFFAEPKALDEIESNDQVLLRYCGATGEVSDLNPECNPNGSSRSIAGICNKQRNVIGLMPHPERVSEIALGRSFGAYCGPLLESVFK